ncbi:Aldo/keto reductase [Mycena sanguinolenta]|uniref:Aldo/keto reductase n=1 Tax=Mycena sanguinolenta TaxID=230812 RepID=A0A8H6XQ63_9AGAR|nr:Aldo/keto reductase [Mycena sanguinolenta]
MSGAILVAKTTRLSGTASDVFVGRVSHGLMMMGRTPESTDEVCFAAIKAGVDRLPVGSKMILNSSEFYSNTWGPENLELLGRFYTKYPEYADRTFLSVKGARGAGGKPDSSMENLRKSMITIERALGPHKKMDLYQPARIDPTMSIEDTMNNLVVLLKEGHFAHIGLSECSAKTLRRAHAVYPVTAAEIEVSLWAYELEVTKVIDTARELDISVLAYSPLGKGFIGGKFSSASELPAGDYRTRFARFKDDTLAHNMQLVSALPELAAKKRVTPAQLAIAWVAALGPHVIPLPGSSTASRTLENCEAGEIELSAEEMAAMNAMAAGEVKGGRMTGGGR